MAAAGWMVITGAGGGIMAAGHGGAGAEPSFGLAIRLPFEQKTNPFIANDPKLINFKYFFTRKLMFVRSSHAIALFPGGFGTMDEGFEVLTLVQTGKSVPMPIVFIDSPGGDFWAHWQDYVEEATARPRPDRPKRSAPLQDHRQRRRSRREVRHFYSNYHSIRYVRDDLVIRLQQPLTGDQLARIKASIPTSKPAVRFRSAARWRRRRMSRHWRISLGWFLFSTAASMGDCGC